MFTYSDQENDLEDVKDKSSFTPTIDLRTDNSKHLDSVIKKEDMLFKKGFTATKRQVMESRKYQSEHQALLTG